MVLILLQQIFGSAIKAQEIIYLLADVKEVVRQGFYPRELLEVEQFCQKNNLFLVKSKFKVLLADELTNGQKYSNKGVRLPETDELGLYFVYISKSEEKALLASYYELLNDHRQLGLLLGYPECCIQYFLEKFHEQYTNLELLPTNPYTNLSMRNQDLVLISHFPCSSNCQPSKMMGHKFLQVLEKYDSDYARQLLQRLSLK